MSGVPLEGAHEPFTSTIWFVDAPFPEVVEARRRWAARLPNHGNVLRWSDEAGPLDRLLSLLEPYAMPSWKSLVVETSGAWTAVFSQGSDLSYVAHYAVELQTRVVRTNWSPHVVRDGEVRRYGDASMWLFDAGRAERSIQASRQDARWVWIDDGDPLPFEDVARYRARLVRDRFDLGALNDYCSSLGIDRANPSSYGRRAVLEEQDTSTWRSVPTMPAARWRAEHS